MNVLGYYNKFEQLKSFYGLSDYLYLLCQGGDLYGMTSRLGNQMNYRKGDFFKIVL